jgi:hypothetical protein
VRHRTTVSWIVYVPSILLAVIALATLVAGVNLHDMEGLLVARSSSPWLP